MQLLRSEVDPENEESEALEEMHIETKPSEEWSISLPINSTSEMQTTQTRDMYANLYIKNHKEFSSPGAIPTV